MMTHDENSRFFSEEAVKKAFQFPDWPAGTEIVCYCRSTDSRDTIEQIAQRGGWKIEKYVHIDGLPIAQLYKSGQVMFAKREALGGNASRHRRNLLRGAVRCWAVCEYRTEINSK